jgi:hypothetical protein
MLRRIHLVPSLPEHARPSMTKEASMQKLWIGAFVAAAMASGAVLGAQGNPSPANTPPADAGAPPSVQRTVPALPAPAAPKADTITISGCIQDTPMLTAGAKPADAAGAPKTFYLNNVVAADAREKGAAVGTSGLTATGYRLDGDEKAISPHLNHQVRIVGTVQGSSTAGPLLKVESVTMVSAKCEQAPTAAKP